MSDYNVQFFIRSPPRSLSTTPNPPITVPAAPTGLTAAALSAGSVFLTWTGNVYADQVIRYDVYRASGLAASFGSATLLTSSIGAALSYTNSGLTTGSQWTYFIVAINVVGSSAASTGASATVTGSATIPAMPTGVTATAVGAGGAILVAWNANDTADNVTQYDVYRASGLGSAFGSASFLTSVGPSTLNYTNSGLTTGNQWTYFIIAVNAIGNSPVSAGASATVLAPGALTDFVTTVPTLGGTQVNVLYVGMKITVGSQNIKVFSLGRWRNPGNSGTHLMKLANAAPNSANVPNGFATVNLTSGSINSFVYGDLITPIVLGAGLSYYVVSEEANPGDSFYNAAGPFGHTTDATLNGSVYGFVSEIAWFEGGTSNEMYGPVDFKYSLTSDAVTALVIGSLYPPQPLGAGFSIWARVSSATSTAGLGIGSVVGTTDLRIGWTGSAPPVSWSGTIQYYYDDEIPIGSPVTDVGTTSRAPLFVTTWDTTTVSNGTHVVYARCIDAVGWSAYNVFIEGNAMVVHNGGFVNGAQDVWVTPGFVTHRFGTIPDKVNFNGNTCPVNASHLPYNGPTFIPPAFSDSRYNTISTAPLLRDSSRFLIEMSRANDGEWEGFFRWAAQSVDAGGGAVGPGGGVFAWAEDPHRGGIAVSDQVSKSAFNALGYDGQRFDNFVNAGFVTYVETPSGDGWYGVDLGGRLFKETHDGTVTTIAGPRQRRSSSTPPWADIDQHIASSVNSNQTAVITQAGEIVGTFDAGIGAPHYMLHAVDLCIDPRNTNILYVASELNWCIFKVDLTGWPTTPAHVSRYAGEYGVRGFRNGAALNAWFNSPLSIQMGADGTMYIADSNTDGVTNGNSLIRFVTPDGSTVGTLCGQPGVPNAVQSVTSGSLVQTYSPTNSTPIAFSNPACYVVNPRVIRFNSTGTQLIMLENSQLHVRRIDLVAQTITYIGRGWDASIATDAAGMGAWVWLDVDRKGTIGPVDDMVLNNPTIGPATYRMSKDATYGAQWSVDAGVTNGVLIGKGDAIGAGHYGWSTSIADTQGRMITSGTLSPAGHRFRIAQATGNDATYMANPSINSTVADEGAYTVTMGSSKEWPANCRPTFYSLFTKTGQAQIGTPTFDDLNVTYPTDAALAAFLQSGAGGIAPRPELTGKQLRDLIYFIRRYSYTGSYPAPVAPGTVDPLLGLWYPIVTSCSATVLSPTSIQVTWTTDKPTIGMAVACTETQFAYGPIAAGVSAWNKFSPIESLTASTYATSHSAVITGLSPNHTIYYNVLVKDLIGNFAHHDNQTIVPGMSPDGTTITGLDLTGKLVTVHGLWTWDPHQVMPTPGWGGGAFYHLLLNGQVASPSFQFAGFQKIVVANGGNVYGATFDQLWTQWVGGQWQPNDGASFASGPAATPTPPAHPSPFIGPYLPSADGTTITSGSGTVTTREGVWTFGAANGPGWDMHRNGVPVYYMNSNTNRIVVTQMKVNSGGYLFYFRTFDNTWRMWASHQDNPSAVGSPGLVVPIDIVLTPSRGVLSASAATGTFLAAAHVIMSDGSVFAGTLATGIDSQGLVSTSTSGLNVVKSAVNISSEVGSGIFFPVTATQNGTSLTVQYNSQVGA